MIVLHTRAHTHTYTLLSWNVCGIVTALELIDVTLNYSCNLDMNLVSFPFVFF